MERCPTQAVLSLVGLAAEQIIRDRYNTVQQGKAHNERREDPRSRPLHR
ncbi:MAG: hypothetical protein ACQESR_10120 [Planctomycetota bacterium]